MSGRHNSLLFEFTVTNAEGEATQTKYNQRFQTVEVKDALNQIYTFGYDPMGRVLSQTRAGGTMSFEYDEVGNRKKRTDYAGRITNYTYDNLNRLKKTEYYNGDDNPTDKLKSDYFYDDISRLTSAVNEAGTVGFTYDNRNRTKTTTDVFGHLIEYEYERTSTVNQKRLKLDGAMYAVSSFDDAGRLSTLVNSSDSSMISFGYDDEDKLTLRTFPNGVTTTYEYYNDDQLKRLTDASSSAMLFDRQYTYNPANQIATITDLTNSRTFGYDLIDRLKTVTASNNQNEFYNFDHVGNRTSSNLSSTYGYQIGKFNQLASTATASYQYDANGNMVSKAEDSNFWRYNWDNENRMVQASTRKQSVRYRYDALGRRVQRYTPGVKENTKFINDGHDVLLDDNDGTLTKYLNAPGIDNKLRVQTGSSVNYFLTDHLGSTNGLADSMGALTASTTYDSFGNSSNTNFPSRYQFTGREFDSFSGLQFSRARFYDPKLGRFISEDPIGFGGGDINLYGYVWNSPGSFTDPTGLDGWGNDAADWTDARIDVARRAYQGDVQDWQWNGSVNTIADLARGAIDPLRVGNGVGNALYAPNLSPWERAGNVANDAIRAAAIVTAVGGALARAAGILARFSGPIAEIEACPIRGRLPGPTVDPLTGEPVGRFVIDPNGNAMIEPAGGSTVPGRNPIDTHTLYPNGSNYQRLNPAGHGMDSTPHGHGHLPGTGPGMKGQGSSIDVNGNVVPRNSPGAHWPTH